MPASATATTPSESMRGLKGKNILVTGGRPSSACATWKASAQEVVATLDISAGNERVLLHRARSRVRRALEEYFDH